MLAHLQVALFYLAPVAIVLALLLGGRYPGEQQLGRLARAVRLRRAPRRARAAASGRRDVVPADRVGGGRVLARRLAGRGPPAVVVP